MKKLIGRLAIVTRKIRCYNISIDDEFTKEITLERHTDRRAGERRVAGAQGDSERRARGEVDRRASVGRRQSDRNPQNESKKMSHQEAMIRRDRLRRQRVKQARLKRRRLKLILAMILIAIVVIGGIGFGIYKIFDVDYVAEGTVLYEAKDYANALISFEEAVEKGDDLDQAYLGIAYCNWELGNYEAIEATFDLAYTNGATVTGASRSILATLALEEEDYETALSYIQEALTLEGNSAELTQELLRNEIACYEYLKEWDMAQEKMTVYIATYPDDEEAATEAEFLETR